MVVTEDGVRVDAPTPPIITDAGDEPRRPIPVELPEATPPAATLVETSGCTLRSQDGKGWIFLPEQPLTEVPVATLTSATPGGDLLPLNPEGSEPEQRQCRVRVEDSAVVPP